MLVQHVTLRVFFLYVAILNLSRSLLSAKSEPLFVFRFNYITSWVARAIARLAKI
jgi:hypothetical protein